eukprot:TRINITY_DN2890_c0_g1_i2.p2 TRINITY_DN2890_c0_g1~~TRINITY_DN2890_c0_g1_i2.p2  ORF type:complete len:121 (-),score=24.02 TRINITY_DN2890_c0_g1_i2:15-377(-)
MARLVWQVLSTGYSRELPGNTHAEECCLLKLSDVSEARGGTIYTTMEPCSERLSGKKPCVFHLIEAGIARVVMGCMEPSNFVTCEGTRLLQQADIQVLYIPSLAKECLAPNRHIVTNDDE